MRERHWNYRVIETVDKLGVPVRAIHEVHYENDRPSSCSENPAIVMWDLPERRTEPYDILARMQEALSEPVLKMADFEAGGSDG